MLERAGYVRPGGTRLFAAQRSLLRMTRIVREEFEARGGQEIAVGEGTRIERAGAGELRSWRQLPQLWFCVHDGARVDCCSIGGDPLHAVQQAILRRLGVPCISAGPSLMAETAAGADTFFRVGDQLSPAELAAAPAAAPVIADPEGEFDPEPFHTPGQKTIADLAAFTKLPETSLIKSIVQAVDGRLMLVLLRGDHALSEAKLAAVTGAANVRPATGEEIRETFGADPGSLGPVGVRNVAVLVDRALEGRRNLVAGANRNDYHFRHVTPTGPFHDLRQVLASEAEAVVRGIEVAHSIRAGEGHPLRVTDASGAEIAPEIHTGWLALDRVLQAAAGLGSDKDGLSLPPAVAPFEVVITPVSVRDAEQLRAAETLLSECQDRGLEAVVDDRDERPGVKFKDNDLVGIPWRITVGKKLAQEGTVEVVERRTKQVMDVPAAAAAAWIESRIYG